VGRCQIRGALRAPQDERLKEENLCRRANKSFSKVTTWVLLKHVISTKNHLKFYKALDTFEPHLEKAHLTSLIKEIDEKLASHENEKCFVFMKAWAQMRLQQRDQALHLDGVLGPVDISSLSRTVFLIFSTFSPKQRRRGYKTA